MGTTMDEDDEGEGRQLTVLGNDRLNELEVSYEELAEEKGLLTEEQLHQLTVRDVVRLTEDQFATVRSDLLVTKIKELIDQALKADEILRINDFSARYRLYAEQAQDREMEAGAVEIRLKARRRLGLMILASEKAEGGKPYHTGSGADPVDMSPTRAPTLAEWGIKGKRLPDESRKLARIPADDWPRHVSKILDKVRNPTKPKSPKLEPMADPSEGPNLGVAAAILSSIRKDIFSRKLRMIIRADAANLRKECEAMIDALDGVWDDIEEEGVVDVKPSTSATLDAEGL
jgi:hypothetical protein